MKDRILLKIPRKEITYLTKIIEGYDNIGIVSTIERNAGLVMIRLTPDTEPIIRSILAELPFVEEIHEDC